MRKIIILVVLILAFLIAGIFIVDERQNAVVYNQITNHSKVYSKGIHFAWPMLERVTYIFMNKRSAAFDFEIKLANKQKVELITLVQWHVINPEIYLKTTMQMNRTGFNKALGMNVQQIISVKSHELYLAQLNQKTDLVDHLYKIESLGVEVNEVKLNEIQLVADTVTSKIAQTVASNQAINIESQVVGLPSINQTALESAYNKAQSIKTEADIEAAGMYQQIQAKNPKFYDYFRKLQIYKSSAKSKQEMPALKDLYTN